MKKSTFVVIGLGRFGLSVIDGLRKYPCEIIAIDSNQEAVDHVARYIEQAYIADSTSEKAMKDIGVQDADYVVVSFGQDLESTIMTFMTLKNIGVKNIIVRCDKEQYKPVLEKLGVDQVISPTEIAGSRLASTIISPDIDDYFQLQGKFVVVEVNVPDLFPAKKIMELDLRNRFGVNVLLIKRNNETWTPKADDIIQGRDKLYVFGTHENIEKLVKAMKKPSTEKTLGKETK